MITFFFLHFFVVQHTQYEKIKVKKANKVSIEKKKNNSLAVTFQINENILKVIKAI